MTRCEPETSSNRISTTQMDGNPAVWRTLGATSVESRQSGVFVQVQFQVDIDVEDALDQKQGSLV